MKKLLFVGLLFPSFISIQAMEEGHQKQKEPHITLTKRNGQWTARHVDPRYGSITKISFSNGKLNTKFKMPLISKDTMLRCSFAKNTVTTKMKEEIEKAVAKESKA